MSEEGRGEERNGRKASDVRKKQVEAGKAAQETVVKRGGYCRGGRRRSESGKRATQIHQGDVFIKALIDGESSQY